MSSYLALAVSVGVLAIVATWLFFSVDPVVAAHMQVWQAFIAWGCLLGGLSPTRALLPTILSIVVGAAFGYVSEAVAGALAKK